MKARWTLAVYCRIWPLLEWKGWLTLTVARKTLREFSDLNTSRPMNEAQTVHVHQYFITSTSHLFLDSTHASYWFERVDSKEMADAMLAVTKEKNSHQRPTLTTHSIVNTIGFSLNKIFNPMNSITLNKPFFRCHFSLPWPTISAVTLEQGVRFLKCASVLPTNCL